MYMPPPLTEEEESELYSNWSGDSWQILAERNIRLALHTANKWHQTGIDDEDLFSLTLFGLTKAAKYFRPELGYKFATFAVDVMSKEILQDIRRRKKHKNVFSADEILYNTQTGDEYTLTDIIPAKEQIEGIVVLTELINNLTAQQQDIVRLLCEGYTQCEIAIMCGCSQCQISRLQSGIKKRFAAAENGRF